jgi:hypothetical protein
MKNEKEVIDLYWLLHFTYYILHFKGHKKTGTEPGLQK